MNVRDRLGVPPAWQRRLTWAMEVGLVGMLFIGIDRGNTGIIVNTAVALGVTQLPAVLRRDYGVPMDTGLTLWLTTAVFLHALGTVGVPGSRASFYTSVWWWDHLTHLLSSSIVAAAGYATARSFDEHAPGVDLTSRFVFVFILLFVLAFGVLWEVIEFVVGELAVLLGSDSVLTQYGLEDTMLDLVFDAVGALVVAVWGTAHLTGVVGALGRFFEERGSTEGE
ncbi:MAG: hypothetical protein ABEJ30_02405 [Halorientalis sp.]